MAVDNIARALAAKAMAGGGAGAVTPEDLEKKYDKTGGIITGGVSIQGDLTVSGTTTTEKEKQLLVEENVIATNANKVDLMTLLSGLAINKNASATYGIMYDPSDDTVKFGEGVLDENRKFVFKDGEGFPLSVRADDSDFVEAHLVKWDSTSKIFVDAGVGVEGLVGPQGPTGPKGDAGPVGPVGPTGAKGADGKDGAGAEVFYIDLAGKFPDYTCPVPLADIKTAYGSGKVLECRCLMGNYTVTLPLFYPGADLNLWVFSASCDLRTNNYGMRLFTIIITGIAGGTVLVSNMQLATVEDKLPNPSALTITSGSNSVTYDGSEEKSIDIPAGPVGPTGPKGDAGLTTEVTVNGTTYTQSEGNIALPDYAKIGTATTNQALSKIEYTTEVAIPTTPETGVEYAITDLISYGDLDSGLQERIDRMIPAAPAWRTTAPTTESDRKKVQFTRVTINTTDDTNFPGMNGKYAVVPGFTNDGFRYGTVVCSQADPAYEFPFIGSITSEMASGTVIKPSVAPTYVSVVEPAVTFTYEYLW